MRSSYIFNYDILIPDYIKQTVKDSFSIYFLLKARLNYDCFCIWIFFFLISILDFPEYKIPEPGIIGL